MGFEKSTEAIREGWPLFIIGGIGGIGGIGIIRAIGEIGIIRIIGVIKIPLIIPIAPIEPLIGATSGVTIQQSSSIPGDAPSTIVRGQNSINANSGPYVVVDGIPLNNTGGSLADIAPNDIESIEILKDAELTQNPGY